MNGDIIGINLIIQEILNKKSLQVQYLKAISSKLLNIFIKLVILNISIVVFLFCTGITNLNNNYYFRSSSLLIRYCSASLSS